MRTAEALRAASATAHFIKKVANLWVAKSNRGGSVTAMISHVFSSTAELRYHLSLQHLTDFILYVRHLTNLNFILILW